MTTDEGEMPIENAAEMLCAAGEIMFGERWKSALATLLGVSPRSVKRWASGEAEIDFDHGAMRDLRNQIKLEIDALQHRRIALIALEERLTDEIFDAQES